MNSISSSELSFTVYERNGIVGSHPAPGFNPVQVPLAIDCDGPDGGYIAIYTRDASEGKYYISNEGGSPIYVAAFLRVQGAYAEDSRIFVPTGGEKPYKLGDDITRDPVLLEACRKHFPKLKSDFWVGGDTGGFFAFDETRRIRSSVCSRTYVPKPPKTSPAYKRFEAENFPQLEQWKMLHEAAKNSFAALQKQKR